MSERPVYRAWDKVDKKMVIVSVIDFESPDQEYIKFYDKGLDIYIHRSSEQVELLQYTGLHDKDGVEIFKGDWCINGFGQGLVVEFSGGCFGFYQQVTPYGRTWFNLSDYSGTDFEVIGNIYTNPELLETQNEQT